MSVENKVARDIMTRDVICIRDNETVANMIELFRSRSITGAPVTDAQDKILGVVSLSDVVRYAISTDPDRVVLNETKHRSDFYSMGDALQIDYMGGFYTETLKKATVSEIMTPHVISVEEDDTLKDVSSTMVQNRIHRVIVMDDGKVSGIISSLDICAAVF